MTDSAPAPGGLIQRLWVRFLAWGRKRALGRKLAVALAIAAFLSVLATYGAITGTPPFGPDIKTVLALLNLNLVLGLTLGVVVARRLVLLWAQRRQRLAGARLHGRLVLLFGGLAAAPAVVVAVFSALYLDIAIQGWFGERVRTALDNSRVIAHAYLNEHQQAIRADILAMAADLNREAESLIVTPERLDGLVKGQTTLRGLSEAIVFDGAMRVIARSEFSFNLEYEPLPRFAVAQADEGQVALLTSENDDRVRALVRLDRWGDVYLYVGRLVDSRILTYVEQTNRANADYDRLEGQRSGIQVTFVMIFGVLSLLLVLAAVWIGLQFANRMAEPIARLIDAAEQIRDGDLSARVPAGNAPDELGTLARAFNRMTDELQSRSRDLVGANRELDQRRQFIETVLQGVTAGVLGLDATGRVTLANRRAADLLGRPSADLSGAAVGDLVPDLADLLDCARRRPDRHAEAQIRLTVDRRPRILLARITAEVPVAEGAPPQGFVLTFDDVTELVTAQRTAAWADVARRIAHEIKNPLTPIQLSAERLKRKYLKEISSDPETFKLCTDTIVRQVGDIGRMVDEFSNFARMPAPVMRLEDLGQIVREILMLQRSARPEIAFVVEAPDGPIKLRCDGRQIRQSLINLVQNAIDAIDGRASSPHGEGGGDSLAAGDSLPQGRVVLRVLREVKAVIIEIIDNGKGLPETERERLTEPYVTTRAKGTGLGLAIVKKIMEDHGGELALDDAPSGGALARLVFHSVDPGDTLTENQPQRAAAGHGA